MLSTVPETQLLVYELNRARHDPVRFQLENDLAVDLSEVAPRPPLAVNEELFSAAQYRAAEMAGHDYFSHRSEVTGDWPNKVVRDHGYDLPTDWPDDQNFIESIAAGTYFAAPIEPLAALITDEGYPDAPHREQLLAISDAFAANREIGVGHAHSESSTFGHYWSIHTAQRDSTGDFLTGVVFGDLNGNLRYDLDEGLAGATIDAGDRSTTTNEAGGWSIEAPSGDYVVTASGPGFAGSATATVSLNGKNVEVDFVSGRNRGIVDFSAVDATTWTNPRHALDVSDDSVVSALDVLLVVTELNVQGSFGVSDNSNTTGFYPDVNADGNVSPLDVLVVVNYLNNVPSGESESADPDGPAGPDTANNSALEGEGENDGILAPGGESLVNTLVPRLQSSEAESTAVATSATGTTVVTFTGTGPRDSKGVFARRYDSDGSPIGEAFRVNTTIRESQQSPSVAIDDSGDFLIAWQGRGPGDHQGIFAQWFDATGNPAGLEMLVNTTTGGAQHTPAVAMTGDGSSVVVWSGTGTGDFDGIFMQRYDADRNRVGGEVLVNTFTADQQAYPSVAMTAGGDVLVTWSSRHQDGSDWGIYGQRFAADGSRVGKESAVNATADASQVHSSVAIDDSGRSVVAWSGFVGDGGGWNIYTQRFDAQGQVVGDEMLVNSTTDGHQKDAKVVLAPSGGYVVSWTSGLPDGSGWEVIAKVFNQQDQTDGGELQVNTVTVGLGSGHQRYSAVALGTGPTAMIVWSGRGQGDRDGVFAQMIDVGGDGCLFTQDFDGWTVGQSGGSQPARVRVVAESCQAVLTEGDSFVVTLATDFTVPETPSALTFTYDNLSFDTTTDEFVNDAFEVALVDSEGHSLVQNFAPGRDAFFNVTESLLPTYREGVQVEDGTATIGLDGIPEGTEATLIFRLTGDDSDTQSTVTITNAEIVDAEQDAAAPQAVFASRFLLQDAETSPVVIEAAGVPGNSFATDTTADGLSLTAQSPLGEAAVGSALVISGNVIDGAATGVIDETTYITVNNRPVDVLDASGHFFTKVELLPGRNEFEISAHTDDRSATVTLSVFGTQLSEAEIDFGRFADITGSFSGVYGRTSIDQSENVLYVDLATRNDGQFEADVPLLVGVKNISQPDVSVLDVDGITPDGILYYDYTDLVPGGRLLPDAVSQSPTVAFSNPREVPFTYELVFYGKLNSSPWITTVPRVEAIIDKPYQHDADAVDPDRDPLTFALTTAPAEMIIDATTGIVSWNPSAEDVGRHDVTVEVTDGRGGSARQAYTLDVIPAPPNRPPVITSTPIVTATVASLVADSDVPVDLSTWSSYWYPKVKGGWGNVNTAPRWVPSEDGTAVVQEVNANPSVFIGDFDVTDSSVTGAFSVNESRDDDEIGFVFGYQDEGHYYLFGWDQGGDSQPGMFVDVVAFNDPDNVEPSQWRSFDEENGGSVRLFEKNNIPWEDFEEYQFELEFHPGVFTIRVFQSATLLDEIVVNDATYQDGLFGFYNSSQSMVRYEGFTHKSISKLTYRYDLDAIDPDIDPLTYSLETSPNGMGIDPSTGLITWGPTEDQVGKHPVTVVVDDGRGGTAEQSFMVCVGGDPNNHRPMIVSEPRTVFSTAGQVNPAQGITSPQAINLQIVSEQIVSETVSLTLPTEGGNFGSADIIFLVDESGSMEGEQAWLGDVITPLDASLEAAGISNNRYGLVGFADTARIRQSGDDRWMTAADFASATDTLSTNRSGHEDGYKGIDFALQNYVFREHAARNIILVTDEDRTNRDSALSFSSMAGDLEDNDVYFSLIANALLEDESGNDAFGVEADGTAYIDDDTGGFLELPGGDYTGSVGIRGGTTADIKPDYVDLAWEVGGITWDLNFLREGGQPADVFTDVFVDVLGINVVRQLAIDVVAGNPNVDVTNSSGIQSDVAPGETVLFDIEFVARGSVAFDLNFVEATTGVILGSIPVTINGDYYYQVQALDPENDPLTFDLIESPVGMQIDSSSGLISWGVADQQAGEHLVSVTVDDGHGGTDQQTFTLTIGDGTGSGEIRGSKFHDRNGDSVAAGSSDTISDNDFVPGTWEYLMIKSPPDAAASGTLERLDSGGNDGPFHRLTHTSERGTFIFSDHLFVGDSYNPQTQGPIDALDLSIDLTHISSGATAIQLLIEQDGQRFYTIPYDGFSGGWQTFTLEGLTPDRFDTNPNVGSNSPGEVPTGIQPDFSTTGGPMRFGYTLGNTAPGGGAFATGITGADNWSVTVNQADPGLAGWTIYLDQNENGFRDPGERFVLTDENGEYAFTGLTNGTYTVREQAQSGWRQTLPEAAYPDDGYVIQLTSGQIVQDVDFGNTEVAESANHRPYFLDVPDDTATASQLYRYDAKATDPDTDPLTFDLLMGPAGMTAHPTRGTIVWLPAHEQVGRQQVLLQVRDDRGGVATQSFVIDVLPENSPPVITSTPIQQATTGATYRYALAAQDADGDEIQFELGSPISGMVIEPVALTDPDGTIVRQMYELVWTPDSGQTGDQPITITARDGRPDPQTGQFIPRGGEATQSFTLSVANSAPNAPPEITSLPRIAARIDSPYLYVTSVVNPDSDRLSYSFDLAPDGMTVDSLGIIRWTPTGDQLGSRPVELTVSDGRGGSDSQAFSVEVKALDENSAPVITSIPTPIAIRGETYGYDLLAEDRDDDPVAWRLTSAPRGMSIDPLYGTLRWTPDAEQLGEHLVEVEGRDPLLASDTQRFTVEVRCSNTAPLITSIPATNAVAERPYLYSVRAEDLERDPLVFSLTDLPDGMDIDESTGLIRWTPASDQIELHEITIMVDDGHASVTQSYTLLVQAAEEPSDPNDPDSPPNSNRPPIITTTPVFTAEADVLYQYDLNATDPDGDNVVYRLGSGPVNMAVAPGSGLVTWTPNADDEGEHIVQVIAEDVHGAQATQGFALHIRVNHPPQITSAPVINVTAGAKFHYSVEATDPDGDPLSYSLGPAPDGMSIDSFGRILWETTGDDIRSHPVSVTVSDDRGRIDSQSFVVTVAADTIAPQVSVAVLRNGQSFADQATVDTETTVVLLVTATDNVGVQQMTLTVDDQNLAIDADGKATFQTTDVGILDVVATATDGAGNTGTDQLDITVVYPGDTNTPTDTTPDLPPQGDPHPNDNQRPVVAITSPGMNASITDLTPIIGTVDDPEDNLWFYRVYTAKLNRVSLDSIDLDDPDWKVIEQGTEEVVDGQLAQFDPSNLVNDAYAIVLAAYDNNGNGVLRPWIVNVEGNVQLGNFTMQFTDVSISLAGIPIEVTRVYDTLNANDEGDFGFGWTLGIQDGQLFETAPPEKTFVAGETRVYITNPQGQRVGFTYQEQLVTASMMGVIIQPYFEPDPGVYDRLEINQTIGVGGLAGAFGGGRYINPNTYTLTTKDGLRYKYHQSSGLQTITDRNGNTVTFSDDQIEHSAGDSIQLIRDHRGRITEVVEPDGNSVSYDYNVNGDLVQFTNQLDEVTTYTYRSQPAHYLDSAFDDAGDRLFTVVYDGERFSHIIDAAGIITGQQQFDLDQRTGIVRDGNGNETTILYDERGNVLEETDPLGNTTYREYGDPRNPDLETRIIDRRGMITDREYDASGNLTRIVEKGSDGAPLDPPIVTAFTYDEDNSVTSITNALNHTTLFEYDDSGNLTQITNALGDTASFTYDDEGQRSSFTDFNGNRTEFDYTDGCDCGSPSQITYADGTYQRLIDVTGNIGINFPKIIYVRGERYYEADGTLVERRYTISDPLNRPWFELDGTIRNNRWNSVQKVYDRKGNLDYEVIVNPDTSGVGINMNGTRIAKANESPSTPLAQRNSRITDYEYDANGNLIRQIDAEAWFNPATQRYEDRNGNERGVTDFRYDANGNRVLLQDPVGNITTWVYDELNREVEERDPFYWESVRASDPELVALSNAEWLERIAPVVPSVAVDPLYDDPSGASCETFTGAEHVRLSCYDEEGNRTATIDRNDRRSEFEYDHAGRLLEETWFDPGDTLVRTITFTYDATGNTLTASDPDSDYAYTYDTLNRLTSIDNNPDGTRDVPHVILTYDYDAHGNLLVTQDNFGVMVESTYDERNRLETRRWFDADVPAGEEPDVNPVRVDIHHSAAGHEAEILLYSDLDATNLVGRTIRTYDIAGRSDLLTHQNAIDEVIAGYDYDYDFAGLLTHEDRTHQDPLFAQSIDYRYDLTGQLVDALFLGQEDEHYEYDANGNRTYSHLRGDAFVTETANQLLSDGTYDYAYDGEGNLVKKTEAVTGKVTTYEYDHHNRMVRIEQWTGAPEEGGTLSSVIEHAYDTRSRRTTKDEAGVTTYVAYNGDDIWAEFDRASSSVNRYLYGPTTDSIMASDPETTSTQYYLANGIGTVQVVVDEAGNIIRNLRSGTFGQVTDKPSGGLAERFIFTGRGYDASTAFYYFRARYYEPSNGRFTSRDPLSFAGGDYNLYAYVGNSPTNGVDPTGQTAIIGYAISVVDAAKGFAEFAADANQGDYSICEFDFQDAGDIAGGAPGKFTYCTVAMIGKYASEIFQLLGMHLGGRA